MKTESKEIKSQIAATLYSLIVASYLIYFIGHRYPYARIYPVTIIEYIILAALSVTLFMKNKKAIVFATGAEVLFSAYNLVQYFGSNNKINILGCTFSLIAYILFIVLIILAIKGNKNVKKLWFLSGCFLATGLIIQKHDFFRYFSYTWRYLLKDTAEIVALFLAGLWIKEDFLPNENQSESQHTFLKNSNTYSKNITDDIIEFTDRPQKIYELLDSNVCAIDSKGEIAMENNKCTDCERELIEENVNCQDCNTYFEGKKTLETTLTDYVESQETTTKVVKRMKIDVRSLVGMVMGLVMIFMGIFVMSRKTNDTTYNANRYYASSYSVKQYTFGADFYTYIYDSNYNIVNELDNINSNLADGLTDINEIASATTTSIRNTVNAIYFSVGMLIIAIGMSTTAISYATSKKEQ